MKATLPAITPSGIFSYRKESCLVQHSGLIQFDIDQKGNEAISNFDVLRDEICQLENVAYCGLSVSGKGFWGLIPIHDPKNHIHYFKFIETWFKQIGLVIDPAPKSLCSLRGYAYDPKGYFNHAAIPLKTFHTEPKNNFQTPNFKSRNNNVFDAAKLYAEKKVGPFRDGNKHNYILHLVYYLLWRGKSRIEVEKWIDINLISLNKIKSNCISYPYKNYNKGRV
jgi:hypothetical protein